MSFSRSIIEPRKGPYEYEVPLLTVMVFIRSDMNLLEKRLARIVRIQKLEEGRIVEGRTDHGAPISLAGPVLGAPHAAMFLEKLIALGARYIFCLGWCGSVSDSVSIGDMVVPLRAVSEEGTSSHYPLRGRKVRASTILIPYLLNSLSKLDCSFHQGKIWTTDAIYRETESKILKYRRQGVLAVEMEMSALFKVALFRKVHLAGMLLVSDELGNLKWRPGFRHPEFKKARIKAAEVILQACTYAQEALMEQKTFSQRIVNSPPL